MVIEIGRRRFKGEVEFEMDEAFAIGAERCKGGRMENIDDDAECGKGSCDEMLETLDVARFRLRESSSKSRRHDDSNKRNEYRI